VGVAPAKLTFQNVNSTGAKKRSACSARGTFFRHLGRASRGPNGEIKLFLSTFWRARLPWRLTFSNLFSNSF
jgi:hypothetical protein